MMLTTALTQMIDRCECIIFLNTPSSISPNDYIVGHTTNSPWIYVELAMSSLIQKGPRSSYRDLAEDAVKDPLRVKYDAPLGHLTELSVSQLKDWQRASNGLKGPKVLELLYAMK